MSDAEKPPPTAGEKAVEAEIAAHLTAFDRHRKQLLDILRSEYKRSRQTNPFDEHYAWQHLRFVADIYLRNEADVSRKQAAIPAADRVELLLQLGNALGNAHRKVDEAMQTVRGPLFLAWCEANGDPDLTDPIMDRYDAAFDKAIASLSAFETVAFRAAETVRRGQGRPPGTSIMPHDFIIALESVYRDITKRKAGAGPGPFAKFVKNFLTALGRECTEGSVIGAIKAAKKREEKHPMTSRWRRSLFGE
jgi:hypothetical protein